MVEPREELVSWRLPGELLAFRDNGLECRAVLLAGLDELIQLRAKTFHARVIRILDPF